MNKTLFDLLAPEHHANEVLATIKNTLPTGDELFNALRGTTEDHGRYFLRVIQKKLEGLKNE
jgi:hypothetical protein